MAYYSCVIVLEFMFSFSIFFFFCLQFQTCHLHRTVRREFFSKEEKYFRIDFHFGWVQRIANHPWQKNFVTDASWSGFWQIWVNLWQPPTGTHIALLCVWNIGQNGSRQSYRLPTKRIKFKRWKPHMQIVQYTIMC